PRKICLIDHAETMTTGASNALLKTLEEPRGDTILILLTDQPNRLLETIRSRCQVLPFTRHPNSRIRDELERQLDVSPTDAHILAALSEGSFKKAFGTDRELYLEERKTLLKTLTGLSSGSILPLLELAEKISEDKTILPEILDIFLAFYRDILTVLHGRSSDELVNLDLQEKIMRVAARENIDSILTKLDALLTAKRQLDRNVNRQLAMEVLLLELAA
ncbi:MAG: DNA polymerase III subunit delta', partial [Desulfuromonadales bacterium]|nr:DNA polymerase III subunit delta' [Desulfuromonadales bacterium]